MRLRKTQWGMTKSKGVQRVAGGCLTKLIQFLGLNREGRRRAPKISYKFFLKIFLLRATFGGTGMQATAELVKIEKGRGNGIHEHPPSLHRVPIGPECPLPL
jgi:hypothetical protein